MLFSFVGCLQSRVESNMDNKHCTRSRPCPRYIMQWSSCLSSKIAQVNASSKGSVSKTLTLTFPTIFWNNCTNILITIITTYKYIRLCIYIYYIIYIYIHMYIYYHTMFKQYMYVYVYSAYMCIVHTCTEYISIL